MIVVTHEMGFARGWRTGSSSWTRGSWSRKVRRTTCCSTRRRSAPRHFLSRVKHEAEVEAAHEAALIEVLET